MTVPADLADQWTEAGWVDKADTTKASTKKATASTIAPKARRGKRTP